MPRTFVFDAPIVVGSMTNQVTVSSLRVTELHYSSTPGLAAVGTGTLGVTLTDPSTGFQETVSYDDASVLAMWGTIGTPIVSTLFAKLVADGKLPAGTLVDTPAPNPVVPVEIPAELLSLAPESI